MKLIIELIDVVIWPFTVIILVYKFRSELLKIANRIQSVSYKDIEASFKKDLNKVESETKSIQRKSLDSIDKVSYRKSPASHYFDRLYKLAEDSPRAAILEAWIVLEDTIKSYAEKNNYEIESLSSYKLIQQIEDHSELPDQIVESLSTVRKLRNQAVHDTDNLLSIGDAERYVESVEILDIYFSLHE